MCLHEQVTSLQEVIDVEKLQSYIMGFSHDAHFVVSYSFNVQLLDFESSRYRCKYAIQFWLFCGQNQPLIQRFQFPLFSTGLDEPELFLQITEMHAQPSTHVFFVHGSAQPTFLTSPYESYISLLPAPSLYVDRPAFVTILHVKYTVHAIHQNFNPHNHFHIPGGVILNTGSALHLLHWRIISRTGGKGESLSRSTNTFSKVEKSLVIRRQVVAVNGADTENSKSAKWFGFEVTTKVLFDVGTFVASVFDLKRIKLLEHVLLLVDCFLDGQFLLFCMVAFRDMHNPLPDHVLVSGFLQLCNFRTNANKVVRVVKTTKVANDLLIARPLKAVLLLMARNVVTTMKNGEVYSWYASLRKNMATIVDNRNVLAGTSLDKISHESFPISLIK